MNKKRVVRLRFMHQPLHGTDNIRLRWHTLRVLLVVGQNHHVLSAIALPLVQERRHVRHIIDTPLQLVRLPKVVDPNQQSLPTTGTGRVLELVVRWRAASEMLGAHGRTGRDIGARAGAP